MRHRADVVVGATVLAVWLTGAVLAPDLAAQPASGYEPPVHAPVADPFRAPMTPYAPGNRGIEFATPSGTEVRTAGHGVVTFAGSVGGSRHVTIGHPDGLRTSYSFLAAIDVVVGQAVRRGTVVGRSTDRLHFGVRDPEGVYLDPALLFDGSLTGRARLVPGAEEGEAALARRERAGFLQLVLERGVSRSGEGLAGVRLALHYATELRPDVRVAHVLTRLGRLAAQQQTCTPVGEPVPRREPHRVALLVGGLGSSSAHAAVDAVDTAALGFAHQDVLRFSYAGGLVPDPGDGPEYAALARNPYDAAATGRDLEVASGRLADVLEAVAAARPGVPIDVIAHSQGGVVARLSVASSAARGTLPDEVTTLATIGSPHQGADLATAAHAGGPTPGAAAPLVALFTAVDPSEPAIGQLSEVSPFVDLLRRNPLPEHVRRVSIAARGDLVVPLPRTMDPGWPSAVIDLTGPSAHERLPSSPATTVELDRAIGGQPPTCAPVSRLAGDVLTGEVISWASDAAGAAVLAA